MEKRSFENGRRKIARRPGILIERHIIGLDHEAAVETDPVVGRIWVTFSGHPHVFHSMKRIFYRTLCKLSRHRADRGPGVRLIFLSAKSSAQPLHVNFHMM